MEASSRLVCGPHSNGPHCIGTRLGATAPPLVRAQPAGGGTHSIFTVAAATGDRWPPPRPHRPGAPSGGGRVGWLACLRVAARRQHGRSCAQPAPPKALCARERNPGRLAPLSARSARSQPRGGARSQTALRPVQLSALASASSGSGSGSHLRGPWSALAGATPHTMASRRERSRVGRAAQRAE